jgi:hypothetical protein
MNKLIILAIIIILNVHSLFGNEKEKKIDYIEKHRMSRFERIPTWRYRNDNDGYVIGTEWKEAMLRWEIRYPIWRRVWEEKEMDKETKKVYLDYVIWDKKNLG